MVHQGVRDAGAIESELRVVIAVCPTLRNEGDAFFQPFKHRHHHQPAGGVVRDEEVGRAGVELASAWS
jgi:hypothetical protein